MGELPSRTFCFGAPGLDLIKKSDFISRQQLAARFGLDFSSNVALVTYHAATLDPASSKSQVRELLDACEKLGIVTLFTKANADAGGILINKEIATYCRKHKDKALLVDNLGGYLYWSVMASCDVMIGNSSSALIEAPSFGTPAVNIGIRQQRRVRAKNIIDVPCQREAIIKGVQRALSPEFRKTLKTIKNPYASNEEGQVGEKIKQCLKNLRLENVLIKPFVDLSFKEGEK